jgi:nucleoside-diphosphate-sugar epimerase
VNVMLTGSSGFTGSRIALYLAQQKNIDKVIGVDCVKPKVFHPKLVSHVVDLADWNTFAPLRDHSPDVVVHAAADQATPYLLHANSVSMKNLLDYCEAQKVGRFIFFSSSYASAHCNNNYRFGKLQSEHDLRKSGLRYVILRPDTIYGVGEPKYQTLLNAIRKRMVPVIGHGRYKRTPCYVWDVATAVHKIIADDNFPGDVFEMGSPTPYTWNEMMSLLGREIGVEHFISVPLPPILFKTLFTITRSADADQMNTLEVDRVMDPTKFIRTFGMPLIDFSEGVSYLCKGDDRWPL